MLRRNALVRILWRTLTAMEINRIVGQLSLILYTYIETVMNLY
jgi:hypothetical protein